MENQLFCGAAKVDITPGEKEVKGLTGLTGIHFGGIIDRLALRVIALENGGNRALIVAFDLDKGPQPVTWIPELAAHTGIPEENILYFGTHTHSAPVTTARPKERHKVSDEERECMNVYEATVKEKLLRCADEAIAFMRPARMGCAYGESFINVNRNASFVYTDGDGERHPYINEGMNWGAWVDRTLTVIRFEDLEGKPIAFFINYPVHCCLMFLNQYDKEGHMGISGDIAGNTSRCVEEKYPGAVAVWSSGAAGDVDPVLFNTFIYPDPSDGHVKKELIPDWRISEMQLRMLVGWHFQDICRTIGTISCNDTEAQIASCVAWSETPSRTEEPYRIRMQALKIGDAMLLGIGGELYSSFGKMLREESPAAFTAVINHNASLIDDAGYILDDDTLARVAQKADTPHFIPGGYTRSLPGYVGPDLKAKLREMIIPPGSYTAASQEL